MLSVLKNTILQFSKNSPRTVISGFHLLSFPNKVPVRNILVPKLQNLMQTCGLKIKGVVKRRCKDCYMVMRDQRLYVECKTYGRHRQVSMAKKPKNTWILSHATQSKVRPW